MKKLFTMLGISTLLITTLICSTYAANDSLSATNGSQTFSSLQTALDRYTSGVIVLQDNARNITVSRDTRLDLNGYDIEGVTVASGTLYCMDSATDDYDITDGIYGTINGIAGSVAAADDYLLINEGDSVSFHKLCLEISTVTLRPGNVGMYYSFRLAGDKSVANETLSFGIALSIYGEPTAQRIGTTAVCSVFTEFPAENTSARVYSTLLKNIMKTENSADANCVNANTVVYARAYIKTDSGYHFGDCVSIRLQTLVESIDNKWSELTGTQQNALVTMYKTYASVMGVWNIPNIQTAATPKENTPATMTKQTYIGVNYWLYTPANPTESMPLIVYLHGGSGRGDDLELITGVDGFPKYIQDGTLSCNAYIIFPQCPSSQKSWKTMGGKIESLIDYTCAGFNLNKSKVSLTGHSMGGTGTWTLALDKPELFYKIAPMSGSVTVSEKNLTILAALPVWAFVGDDDKIVSPDTSIAMIEALQTAGADAKLTVFEGADHFAVPGLGYLGSDVINWLIS